MQEVASKETWEITLTGPFFPLVLDICSYLQVQEEFTILRTFGLGKEGISEGAEKALESLITYGVDRTGKINQDNVSGADQPGAN